MNSIPFYDFPKSPILIIGALGILVASLVYFLAYQKYFSSPLNREIKKKKKNLMEQKNVLSEKLEAVKKELNSL
tara:strand:+ start:1115 stop:1336 length:222 start_codon:yes stop_codon:yes gene_type:complete